MSTRTIGNMSPILLSLVLVIQCYQPVCAAAKPPELKSETPSVDPSKTHQTSNQPNGTVETPANSPTSPTKVHTTTRLNGSIHKHGAIDAPDAIAPVQTPTQHAEAASDSVNLQAETAKPGSPAAYALVAKKLANKQELTANDYRSLAIGIVGYDYDRTYFTKFGKVTTVYPGCPAQEAGIKVGDQVVVDAAERKSDDSKVVDSTVPTWYFTSGKAGDIEDVTIKRHGKKIAYHLVRMNMEDVPDPKVRQFYEKMVQQLGGAEGTFQIADPSAPGSN